MEKLFDTHAHLQFEKFDQDRAEVVKRTSAELFAVVNPGANLDSSVKAVEMVKEIPNFYASVGVHPHHIDQWNKETLRKFEELLKDSKVVAVGEIGLDNHLYQGYPEPDLKSQGKILEEQIELAQTFKKPILFHCRKAYDELYKQIKNKRGLKGLIHCFMGEGKVAQKFLDLGLFISFAGNLTYKNNEKMRQAAKEIPLEFLLTETDSPYLAPEPIRGTRNEPTNVLYVAKTIASLKNLTVDEIAKKTRENARRLFNL